MQLVQFQSSAGRRLGLLSGDTVLDLTAARVDITRVVEAFAAADAAGSTLDAFVQSLADAPRAVRIPWADLAANTDPTRGPVLRPAVDHADLYRVLVSGTGLSHLGSMQSRDQMHAKLKAEDEATKSDSKKMFEMGLRGGRPAAGERGVMPEWFYKGNGAMLRGCHEPLDLPGLALDGGEEPEIVACYAIDRQGKPRRLGFALGNEWSDHATEKINYLYLAPSKLRTCALGPVLVTDSDFQHVELRCTVARGGKTLYDSGPLYSGEEHMCHALANLEDHHFKYPQHRVPGDVHVHFLGTSKLSFGERTWKYADGDVIRIEAPGFSPPLVNTIRATTEGGAPARVERA